MILRTLLAAAVLVTAARADFDRHLSTGSQPDLYLSTGSGHVHLYPGSDNEIHVKAHVYAGWNAGGDIQDRIRRISDHPPIQQSGNSIHIGENTDRTLYSNITIDYEISAPRGVALNLHSGSGDLEIDNLSRFLKADTGSGSVRAHGTGGPADLHTGSGDVELQQSAPGEVKASTGSGSIRIAGANHSDAHHVTAPLNGGGPTVEVHTGSGDVEID